MVATNLNDLRQLGFVLTHHDVGRAVVGDEVTRLCRGHMTSGHHTHTSQTQHTMHWFLIHSRACDRAGYLGCWWNRSHWQCLQPKREGCRGEEREG